jgi:hypothetical protein
MDKVQKPFLTKYIFLLDPVLIITNHGLSLCAVSSYPLYQKGEQFQD